MIETELEKHQPGADRFARGEVRPDLMRHQVRVRDEVFTRNLSLPPGAPVMKPQEERIEILVGWRGRIVTLKKRVAIRERWLPRDVLQLIRAEQRPCVRIERIAVPLRCVLEFKRQVG